MSYSADFSDAHVRHWQDAELLVGAGRWANADQLYGFSAECGLKAVMVALGMEVDGQGVPKQGRHRKHIEKLWSTFLAFVDGRPAGRLLRHLPCSNPFADWSPHNRYAGSHHFDSVGAVDAHREGAQSVRQFCLRFKMDGGGDV